MLKMFISLRFIFFFLIQAGQISYEEAILAKQQCIQDKRDEAQKFREECRELMAHYFSQKIEEKNEMRRLVEATTAGQKNIKEARIKLTAMKQKIGWPTKLT